MTSDESARGHDKVIREINAPIPCEIFNLSENNKNQEYISMFN